MIDQGVFKTEWAVLCERFRQEPSQVLAARYYQSLSPRMDTEAFRAASREVFDRCEFFPRPADFLEAAEGDESERALEEWELCQSAMRGSRKALSRMSDAGRKTVRLMGGLDRLRMAPVDDLHFRRSEFLRLYPDAEDITRREEGHRLPPSSEAKRIAAGAVPRLMGNPDEQGA